MTFEFATATRIIFGEEQRLANCRNSRATSAAMYCLSVAAMPSATQT